VERLTNFRYRMIEEDRNQEMLATVLASSFDFYEHRLNLAKHDLSLIVCQKHNAAAPIFTLELDTGILYEPGTPPDTRAIRKRRTADEQKVLISQIIIGAEVGMRELRAMPARSRERYLALRAEYLRPKVGRPWAS
jgi:hypothetical protein